MQEWGSIEWDSEEKYAVEKAGNEDRNERRRETVDARDDQEERGRRMQLAMQQRGEPRSKRGNGIETGAPDRRRPRPHRQPLEKVGVVEQPISRSAPSSVRGGRGDVSARGGRERDAESSRGRGMRGGGPDVAERRARDPTGATDRLVQGPRDGERSRGRGRAGISISVDSARGARAAMSDRPARESRDVAPDVGETKKKALVIGQEWDERIKAAMKRLWSDHADEIEADLEEMKKVVTTHKDHSFILLHLDHENPNISSIEHTLLYGKIPAFSYFVFVCKSRYVTPVCRTCGVKNFQGKLFSGQGRRLLEQLSYQPLNVKLMEFYAFMLTKFIADAKNDSTATERPIFRAKSEKRLFVFAQNKELKETIPDTFEFIDTTLGRDEILAKLSKETLLLPCLTARGFSPKRSAKSSAKSMSKSRDGSKSIQQSRDQRPAMRRSESASFTSEEDEWSDEGSDGEGAGAEGEHGVFENWEAIGTRIARQNVVALSDEEKYDGSMRILFNVLISNEFNHLPKDRQKLTNYLGDFYGRNKLQVKPSTYYILANLFSSKTVDFCRDCGLLTYNKKADYEAQVVLTKRNFSPHTAGLQMVENWIQLQPVEKLPQNFEKLRNHIDSLSIAIPVTGCEMFDVLVAREFIFETTQMRRVKRQPHDTPSYSSFGSFDGDSDGDANGDGESENEKFEEERITVFDSNAIHQFLYGGKLWAPVVKNSSLIEMHFEGEETDHVSGFDAGADEEISMTVPIDAWMKPYVFPFANREEYRTFERKYDANSELSSDVLGSISAMGYSEPSYVQAAAITCILENRTSDVLIVGSIGTGKTAAYLIPLIQRLHEMRKKRELGCHGIIIAPNEQLCQQITQLFSKLKQSVDPVLTFYTAVGAKSLRIAKEKLSQYDCIVGTLSRVSHLAKHGRLDPRHVRMLVLDEADVFVGETQSFALYELISRLDPNLQCILTGSYFSPRSLQMFSKFVRPFVIQPNAEDYLLPKLNHYKASVSANASKLQLLAKILDAEDKDTKLDDGWDDSAEGWGETSSLCENQVMVFCQSKESVESALQYLMKRSYQKLGHVHEGTLAMVRAETLLRFAKKELRVLLCTPSQARGVDFPAVKVVVNFDFPQSNIQYLLQAGRTGRFGKTGSVYSITNDQEYDQLKRVELFIQAELKLMM